MRFEVVAKIHVRFGVVDSNDLLIQYRYAVEMSGRQTLHVTLIGSAEQPQQCAHLNNFSSTSARSFPRTGFQSSLLTRLTGGTTATS